MSRNKHKGDHGRRAERRAAQSRLKAPATAEKPRRVYLRNPVYILLTSLTVLGVVALLVGFQLLDWWDNVIGSVLSVLVGAFGCMCLYDLGLLMTACITFGEGMVNAGKNAEGQLMLFHAASVERIEVRDRRDTLLTDDRSVYKNVTLVFVMTSGRVNRRPVSRLSAAQLARVREAWEAERTHTDNM